MSAEGLDLCAAGELVERGKAFMFEVSEYGRPVSAFAVRFEGQVVAYLNRCAHVPTEMDWQSGEFFDSERRWLMCATHGAMYEPLSGHCVRGPCAGKRLTPIPVREIEGRVYWYPSRSIQSIF